MKKIKSWLEKFFNNYYASNIVIILGMLFSFLIIDVGLRYFSNQYELVYRYTHASPLFFSISWVFLFIGIIYLFRKKVRMWIYGVLVVIFNILTIAQILHMKILARFFGLSDLLLAGEGADYFGYALRQVDKFTLCLVGVSILASIVTLVIMKKSREVKTNKKYYLGVILGSIILFSLFRFSAINRLGPANNENIFNASYNVKNIYIEFNNQTKNMEIAGLYEQTFRNSYKFIVNNCFSNKKEMANEVIELVKDENHESVENDYTGMFEGKNLVFVLLESIDSFLVDDEIMPTLSMMAETGWNFTNRYAPTFGGGMTINSEFAANTGLYSLNNSTAIYNFDNNDFSSSLPSLMKDNGYITDSIHVNYGKYYNRSSLHKALGFSNHYALSDMNDLDKSYNYFLDSSLVKNEDVYKMIVKDEKFMTYITTYSAHLPYDTVNPSCNNMYGLDVDNTSYGISCIYNLARDTDEMLRIMVEKLERDDKLDDTVFVLFSDHYLYGYNEDNYIFNRKDVEDAYMAQNVPFIIWNNNIKNKEIDTVMDTADITPTLLNLFGITYDPTDYIGDDVFSDNHDNFVYFDEDTFYDGSLYYNDSSKLNSNNKDYIEDVISKINYSISKNDNIILSNYYYYKNKSK